ncbi:L,D-transpeptidase family protein [Clostridium rectalis]|uniref:L,D-transpeptidase family protein n=1 Tax=Clostridium rectalis TaxID=2040295 RepID=UPI000F63239E|nr:L,D-transpeptidase family protein [Clostridium rectalis]
MSKFKKLLFTLIFIFIIEIILIYLGYKKSTENSLTINGYNPKKPLVLIADITLNELFVFQDNKCLKTYIISGGKPSTPSPIGTWKIISKDTWGEGFGGHWMGFNVPWGKYGIHGTIYPNSLGWNSSKGCIRMNNKDVAELYKIVKHNTPVIIYGGPYGDFGEYLRPIKPGMIGSDIYKLQQILKEKGYFKGEPNGIYNQWMIPSINKFQKEHNLPINNTIDKNFFKKLGVELID